MQGKAQSAVFGGVDGGAVSGLFCLQGTWSPGGAAWPLMGNAALV